MLCDTVDAMKNRHNVLLDLQGLHCPMPLLKAKRALNGMNEGERLCVVSTDPASVKDFKSFAKQSGNVLLESDIQVGKYTFLLEKRAG